MQHYQPPVHAYHHHQPHSEHHKAVGSFGTHQLCTTFIPAARSTHKTTEGKHVMMTRSGGCKTGESLTAHQTANASATSVLHRTPPPFCQDTRPFVRLKWQYSISGSTFYSLYLCISFFRFEWVRDRDTEALLISQQPTADSQGLQFCDCDCDGLAEVKKCVPQMQIQSLRSLVD